ncbi:MAG: hypothetical protein QOD06_632 [Candidatus Binatota bacterium]|nr:hypothetical protein [Candidatus Binatota bacterium]
MSDVILHHYALSPFSEKIRRILAYKKIPWRGVDQPIVAPKPKLTPLTGGYRRIPVLQIGADVYCDTVRIAQRLEELRPEPTCYPGGNFGVSEIVAQWADHRLFFAVVPPVIVKMLPVLPPEFIADRRAMSPGLTEENLTRAVPDATSQLAVAIDWIDRQLRGRRFLLGDAFGVADAACFHCLWFLRNHEQLFAWIGARPALRDWFARIEAFGAGDWSPMDADEALALAARSAPAAGEAASDDPNGLRPGERVAIVADDYGPETVEGTLERADAQELAVRRNDPAVGEVVVHFPRSGFRIMRS